MHNCLNNVLTLQEAAALYGVASSTLRNAIRKGLFKEEEIKKSGSTWIVLKKAMDRLYGQKETEEFTMTAGFYIHCPRCTAKIVLTVSDGTLECVNCGLIFCLKVKGER